MSCNGSKHMNFIFQGKAKSKVGWENQAGAKNSTVNTDLSLNIKNKSKNCKRVGQKKNTTQKTRNIDLQ